MEDDRFSTKDYEQTNTSYQSYSDSDAFQTRNVYKKPTPPTLEPPANENIIAGIVGAFLFSLIGGVAWFILYQINFIAAISGIIGVTCAIKGYESFGKKLSLHGVILSVIIATLVIIAAWYLCLSFDVYKAYLKWYDDDLVDYVISIPKAIRTAYLFLKEPDIAASYIKDLVIGLFLCIVGCIQPIRNAIQKAKNE